jgi:hypothetical protein
VTKPFRIYENLIAQLLLYYSTAILRFQKLSASSTNFLTFRSISGPELHGKKSYRVHDLLLDFAQTKLQDMGTLNDVQDKFVKALRGLCVDGEWNDNSTTCQKDYYFKYLPYHIYSSGRHGELLQLLFDLHWLKQKVKHINVFSVISDFRFVDTESKEIQLLKSSLMFSADVINENPDSICPQLLGNSNNEL